MQSILSRWGNMFKLCGKCRYALFGFVTGFVYLSSLLRSKSTKGVANVQVCAVRDRDGFRVRLHLLRGIGPDLHAEQVPPEVVAHHPHGAHVV